MPQTPSGINYPDRYSEYPSALWWKALAESLDPFALKLDDLPDIEGLEALLGAKIDKPEGAIAGQVLTWNGSAWIAYDAPSGEGSGTGGGGASFPISQRGSLLIGTGSDWIVLPTGRTGETLIVDPANGYGYRWGSPLPAPTVGTVLVGTSAGWVTGPKAARDGLALISDASQPQGMKWSSPLPNPARGSVLVADGTQWVPAPWSGRDGDALLVDAAKDLGVRWGGVLPSPLKGALLIGDGVTWRLVTPPAGERVFVSDVTTSMGVAWSDGYVKRTELEIYATKALLDGYVLKKDLDALVENRLARRWTGWKALRLASGWRGTAYVNTDGTELAFKGTLYPGSGAGNTMAYLPTGVPTGYAEGTGAHKGTIGEDQVRISIITLSGTSITTHGVVTRIDTTYGVRLVGTRMVL